MTEQRSSGRPATAAGRRWRTLPWPVAAALVLLLTAVAAPRGRAVEEPARRVILTVTGALDRAGADGSVDLTLEELERLGTVELVTTTPFTRGPVRFTGVLLRRLLEAVGARGDVVHATALNDYMVEIPRADAARYDVVLATRADGEPLPVRAKGPLWVVYPWSRHPELDSPLYGARSIWQVRSLEIR
mgnify:CR=1 FL=1